MKKISIIAGLAALAGLFAGCIKEEAPATPETPEVKMVEITLSTDSYPVIGGVETKTQLVGTAVHWKKGDRIKIAKPIRSTNANDVAYLEVLEDGARATFKGKVPESFLTYGTLQIMYPYTDKNSEGNDMHVSCGSASLGSVEGSYAYHWTNSNLPSDSQELLANTFADDANISFAQVNLAEREVLKFKNFTGLYELNLKGDITIDRVEITLTGVSMVAKETDKSNIFYNINEDGSYDFHHRHGGTTVTLTSADGVTLKTGEYTSFYASVAPQRRDHVKNPVPCTIKVYEKGKSDAVLTKSIEINPVKSGKIIKLGEYSLYNSTPLYFRPGAWTSDSANIVAYLWTDSSNHMWLKMTDEDKDGVFTCDAPDIYKNVIFCRYPSDYAPVDGEYDWTPSSEGGALWNQTSDICDMPTNADRLFIVNDGEWNGAKGTWSNYVPATVLYLKPNTQCEIALAAGEFNEYAALFSNYTLGYWSTSGSFVKEGDLYKIAVPAGTSRIQLRAKKGTGDHGNISLLWKMTDDFYLPVDGKNLFVMDEKEFTGDEHITGIWSVKE